MMKRGITTFDQNFVKIFHRDMTQEEKELNSNDKIQSLEQFCKTRNLSFFKDKKDQEIFLLYKFFRQLQIDNAEVLLILNKLESRRISNLEQMAKLKSDELQFLNLEEQNFQRMVKQLQQYHNAEELLSSTNQNLSKSVIGHNSAINDTICQNQNEEQQTMELLNLKKLCPQAQSGNLFYPTGIADKDQEYLSIMVVGEVGSGKSSFLNYLLNYYLGIQNDQEQKFILQNKSGPAVISSYISSFNKMLGLKLIDTPGLGNERDHQKSSHIFQQIFEYLETQNFITCFCFVVQSQNGRLTQTQNHLLGLLIKYFGISILKNLKFIFTFCDTDSEPQSLEAIKFKGDKNNVASLIFDKVDLLKVPYYFKVNCINLDDISSTKEIFRNHHWNLTMKNIQLFYNTIIKMKPFELTQYINLQKQLKEQTLNDQLQQLISKGVEQFSLIKSFESKHIISNSQQFYSHNNLTFMQLFIIIRNNYYDQKKNLINIELSTFECVEQICKLTDQSFIIFMELKIKQALQYRNYHYRYEYLNRIIEYKLREKFSKQEITVSN